MAAKTLHELEIEVEKMKVEISILRRDLDMMLKIYKQDATPEKINTDGGENIK